MEAVEQEVSIPLGAMAQGGAELTYASDTEAAPVDSEGNVTIPAGFTGTINVTVTAAPAGIYRETSKTVAITVN